MLTPDPSAAGRGGNLPSEKKYLLSPRDLAAFDILPELIAAGVSALKIEGRLKASEYVAVVTRFYRRAVDEAAAGRRADFSPPEIAELEAAFSRGFSHGWIEGPNHRTLVAGDSSAKRGVLLGEVRGMHGNRVRIALASPVRRGMGVVFQGDRDSGGEQGGRIFEVFVNGRSWEKEIDHGEVELTFRHDTLDFRKIAAGQKVWQTNDPQLAKKWRRLGRNDDPRRRVPLDLSIEATPGAKLLISGRTPTGAACRLESPESLKQAQKHPLTQQTLREQLGRLGGTIYEIRRFEAAISGRPMIPFSELGKLRRTMIEQLDASMARPEPRNLFPASGVEHLRKELRLAALAPGPFPKGSGEVRETSPHAAGQSVAESMPPQLHVLCRSLQQIEAAANSGAAGVIADFQEVERYAEAMRVARNAGCAIVLAALRIHRPGDVEGFARLERQSPDGILARNLAAIAYFNRIKMPVIADFSLNAANELTVLELLRQGAGRVTAAYDLRRESLGIMLENVPPHSIEVIVHGRMPMFHTAHCLFCAELSAGRDARDCGRPCGKYQVRIRDRRGAEHVLLADADCRNTVYHATALSKAESVPEMLQRGVRHFRLELLDEDAAQTRRLIETYSDLLLGRISARNPTKNGLPRRACPPFQH